MRALGATTTRPTAPSGGTAALSPTLVAIPRRTGGGLASRVEPVFDTGSSAVKVGNRARFGWVGDSIGYIYVYLRGKLDAEERRRRLLEERAGAKALLSGAINELGITVLREGIQHPDITGLLEAIGRAHARREAAAADMAASESLQQAEATRLGAEETAAEAEAAAAERASRDAEEVLRATVADRRQVAGRLSRLKEERARVAREASAPAGAGAGHSADLEQRSVTLAADQRGVEHQLERLDAQLSELRARAAGLRAAASAAKNKHDQTVAARRQAASQMAASIAGRLRDRAAAEREVGELTQQLGRVASDVRIANGALLSGYQTIDRLNETLRDRSAQLAALAQSRAHYDQRKLLTGVGLVTSMLLATAAAVWAVLK